MRYWKLKFAPRRVLSLATFLVGGGVTSGCTLIGAGVGAGVDSAIPGPYELHPVAEKLRLNAGDRIKLKLQNGITFEARFVGFRAPTPSEVEGRIVVKVESELVSLRLSEVREIGVEVVGKGWLYGGLVGLAVDTTVIVATVISVRNMRIEPFGNSHGSL